jgi:steroid delta-isomerase-like uncharacterized protein
MDTIIDLQKETISKHLRAEIAKDWDAVYDTFVQGPNTFYDAVPLGIRLSGIQGVKDFHRSIHNAFPDFTVLVSGAYDTPGCSIREVTIAGTHSGEYGGIPPSGNQVEVEVAVFFVFDTNANPGKILVERVYYDNESVLRQCRGETSAPTKIGLADMYSNGMSL